MKDRFATLALALLLAAPLASADDPKAPPAKAGPAKEKDWRDHTGNIPFIVGTEKGLREAEFTGKPILYFFTATG